MNTKGVPKGVPGVQTPIFTDAACDHEKFFAVFFGLFCVKIRPQTSVNVNFV